MDHGKIRANLSAYKDGELHGNVRDEIARHLQVCHACREEFRELDQIDSLVRELPEICVPENFTSEIVSKAHRAMVPRHRSLSLPRRILDRLLFLGDSVFGLFRGYEVQESSLDEFGDCPPLSLSHAYFQLIGR